MGASVELQQDLRALGASEEVCFLAKWASMSPVERVLFLLKDRMNKLQGFVSKVGRSQPDGSHIKAGQPTKASGIVRF